MMYVQIRRMIDEIFADMKMTAENLALRDELMDNAQERFDDSIRMGKTEEEAFAEVVSSLGDVQSLLREMNEEAPKNEVPKQEAPQQEVPQKEEKPEEPKAEGKKDDLNQAFNKAMSAIGDLSRQSVKQAMKLVGKVDKATGGLVKDIGKAVDKGMRDAQKAAGTVIDKWSNAKGEIVIDFGKDKKPEEMRREADDLRAQAIMKRAAGDEQGAAEMESQADEKEMQADAAEQEAQMKAAQDADSENEYVEYAENLCDEVMREAGEATDVPPCDPKPDEQEEGCEKAPEADVKPEEDGCEDGKVDFVLQDDKQTPKGKQEVSIGQFPAAGLRCVDIGLDADDVVLKPGQGQMIEIFWEASDPECPKPVVSMEGHTLTLRRQNPDVFKTFFSVFKKEGGKVTLRVPRGYAADYTVGTTSGDIRLYSIDVDNVKINTTSGDVRLEPDAGIRAKDVTVTTVSGDATVSVCAEMVSVSTVSGDPFVSCDAAKIDVNTVSGKVHVEGACEAWNISTVSGDAELLCTVTPAQKMQIGTMSGSARVALPGDVRGFVADMSSMSGSIVNEFGPNRYGTCALPIHMDTVSGSLMITRL